MGELAVKRFAVCCLVPKLVATRRVGVELGGLTMHIVGLMSGLPGAPTNQTVNGRVVHSKASPTTGCETTYLNGSSESFLGGLGVIRRRLSRALC